MNGRSVLLKVQTNCKNLDLGQFQHLFFSTLYSPLLVKDHIPHSGKFSKHLPGWNQFIKPLPEDMNFWHSVWVSAGRPINTVLRKVYKNVRNQYRYAVRKIKQHKKAMKDNNYLLAAANGKINDILKDLRNQRKPKAYLPNAIDKITDPQEISNHFGSIYNNIYNHHDDTDKIQKILEDLDQKVSADDTHWLSQINSKLIFKIINKLKFKKNDENFKFKSDAFIISSHLLCKPLCMLFKGYLVHGHFTDVFLLSSLVPIVKDGRKSKLNSNNYRLIAVSSLLLKLIDLLVLELFKDNLQVSSLQFGLGVHRIVICRIPDNRIIPDNFLPDSKPDTGYPVENA